MLLPAGKRDRGRSTSLDRAAPSRSLARLSSTVFRLAVSATVGYPAFDVAYDGLPTVIDVNMLDANVLLPAVTQPSKNLYLGQTAASPTTAVRFICRQ
jgi:hypothetical protein